MNIKCLLRGHKVYCKKELTNSGWGKPNGEWKFYYHCVECDKRDYVELKWHTTGRAESEYWEKPISHFGRKFSKHILERLKEMNFADEDELMSLLSF